MPEHGAERNRREVERQIGEPSDFVMPDGTVLHWSAQTMEETVSEMFCEACGWQEVSGILVDIMGCPACGRDW